MIEQHNHHIQAFHAMPDRVEVAFGCFAPNYSKPGVAARMAAEADEAEYRHNPASSGFGALCRLRRGI